MTSSSGSKSTSDETPVVFFDGVCNLCNGAVQFIIRHERNHALKFAPLQGETFKLKHATHNATLPDSIVFSVHGRLCTEAEAVIAISEYLKQPWRFFGSVGRLVPAFLANALYRFVARNRYRWFGKREACYLPTRELKARFLE